MIEYAAEILGLSIPEFDFYVRIRIQSFKQRLCRVLLEHVAYLMRPLDDDRLNVVQHRPARCASAEHTRNTADIQTITHSLHTSLRRLQRGCKVLQYVCLSVCLSVCLFVCAHNSKSRSQTFWPWLGLLIVAMLYGFTNSVIFLNGKCGVRSRKNFFPFVFKLSKGKRISVCAMKHNLIIAQ